MITISHRQIDSLGRYGLVFRQLSQSLVREVLSFDQRQRRATERYGRRSQCSVNINTFVGISQCASTVAQLYFGIFFTFFKYFHRESSAQSNREAGSLVLCSQSQSTIGECQEIVFSSLFEIKLSGNDSAPHIGFYATRTVRRRSPCPIFAITILISLHLRFRTFYPNTIVGSIVIVPVTGNRTEDIKRFANRRPILSITQSQFETNCIKRNFKIGFFLATEYDIVFSKSYNLVSFHTPRHTGFIAIGINLARSTGRNKIFHGKYISVLFHRIDQIVI